MTAALAASDRGYLCDAVTAWHVADSDDVTAWHVADGDAVTAWHVADSDAVTEHGMLQMVMPSAGWS